MKKNDIIETEIIDYSSEGKGIAKLNDYVIFVPFVAKGEKVKIKINHVKRSLAYGDVIEIIETSKNRVDVPCNRFNRCGGCSLMHLSYEEQLRLKEGALANVLRKNANIESGAISPIVSSNSSHSYRNKMQLKFGKVEDRVTLGFYEPNTHKVVSIKKCFLHGDWAERLISIVLAFANKYKISVYDEKEKKGILRHIVARYLNDFLCVVLVVNSANFEKASLFVEMLKEEFKAFSLYISPNKKDSNVIMGDKCYAVYGEEQKVNILGIKASVNPYSFLQINDEIRDKLYLDVIKKIENIENSIVIDAYSGIGILGNILAQKGAKVYNIDIIKEAIEDADRLAISNGMQYNIVNICGDSAIVLPEVIEKAKLAREKVIMEKLEDKEYLIEDSINLNKNPFITIILDPPRKGCDAKVLQTINQLAADESYLNVIYISCNPATLSRDLNALKENFSINSIVPYDMFPQTYHLETLVCIERK